MVASRQWDNAGFANAGAITWRNGDASAAGVVSAANSVIGIRADHQVGSGEVAALTKGHFVFRVSGIDAAASAANMGSAIWADGVSGVTEVVSSMVGLAGSNPNDGVGGAIVPLTNGNYVVASITWANGAATNAGAVTWRDGTGASSATVSPANSIVGIKTSDLVGNLGTIALSTGNYVVSSSSWDNGVVANVDAVTWGNGLGGTVGLVSAANSLVGTVLEDRIGEVGGVAPLSDGNFVVASALWDGGVPDAGAVTWGNGQGGTVGSLNASNSLVGSTLEDRVGNGRVFALPDGMYCAVSTLWDFGASVNARAASLGKAMGATVGPLSLANSVPGVITPPASISWEPARQRLAVGRGTAVSFISYETISFDGFE